MFHSLHGPIGRVRGKNVFLTDHTYKRIRERRIGIDEILDTLRYPWRILRDVRYAAKVAGFTRLVYVSLTRKLIVVVEEDQRIIVVSSWRRVRDIRDYVEKRIRGGRWVEYR